MLYSSCAIPVLEGCVRCTLVQCFNGQFLGIIKAYLKIIVNVLAHNLKVDGLLFNDKSNRTYLKGGERL